MIDETDQLRAAIERHEQEITRLSQELDALKAEATMRELQAELDRRVAELEADIKFQELQEQIAREEAERGARKTKKRGWLRR